MKKKSFLIAGLALFSLVLTSCDQNTPDWIDMYCTGRLFTDHESQTPIVDALVTPELYYWTVSDYTGQIDHTGWATPFSHPHNYCESLGYWGIFVTDDWGCWGGKIHGTPTKLRLQVVYLDKDSIKHHFTTKEYKYENELSLQKINIYASDYE